MRYMTKEWYETVQKTSFYLNLKVSKKAETYSECYFKELYKQKENEWLELWKNVYEISIKNAILKEFYAEYGEGVSIDDFEFEKIKNTYIKHCKQKDEGFNNIPEFNPEQEKKKHKRALQRNVKCLREKIPEDILQNVADIRVLALRVASREVKQKITKYCKQNEKKVNIAIATYQKEYRKQFQENEPDFISELFLHDCTLLSCRKKGNDIVMTIDNSNGFTDISEIRMINCNIIKQDAPLHGAWCLYEEVYKSGDRFELHFLFQKKNLIDFIVTVDDIKYKYND